MANRRVSQAIGAFLFTAMLLPGPGIADAATGLVLSASASCRAVRLGDEVRITLKIEGDGVADLIGSTPGARLTSSSMAGFQWGYEFATEQEGRCTFGPYTLNLNGQALTSSPVVVKVLPKWDGRYGTFFRTDSDRIRLGETIELLKETWRSGPIDFASDHFRIGSGGTNFDCNSGPSTSSHKVSAGATNSYARQSWLIKPRKAGDFAITRELFTTWPEGIAPPDLVVHVEPAKTP